MNRRRMMTLSSAALALQTGSAQVPEAAEPKSGETPDTFLLKDYRPVSIYRVPQTEILRAKYPVTDVHCHGIRPVEQLGETVKLMDSAHIQKTVIFSGAANADRVRETRAIYDKYPGRFDIWCSFDFTGVDEPGFGPNAVKALEECHAAGAMGIGELSDKGWGFRPMGGGRGRGPGNFGPGGFGPPGRGRGGRGPAPPPAHPGPHLDDARMDALLEKCAELGMPINTHISDPIWSYQRMDLHNDGLMNGYSWRIDEKQPGLLGHNGLIESLDKAVGKHPKAVFIACHLANLDYDLNRLAGMFDRHPNLYADISARFAETATIPRAAAQFLTKYQDRVLYGTDMPYNQKIFSTTFRVLESNDDHFYEQDLYFNFDYHWPMYGMGLPDAVLKKIYGENAQRAFQQARRG